MTDDEVRPDGAAATAPGRLVGGRYRLRDALGSGGMGTVWAARDELLDREVAVKEVTLPAGLRVAEREQLRQRTLREARAAARIRSEAAVTVYDVVEEDGRPWIVMELLPARSLADVLREEGPMDVAAASRTGLRLLDALAAAHRAGVLHRDVKPANVLFDAAGSAVLTDFGIASLEGDPSTTTTGTVVGSPGYVAPERALGHAPTAASDLWSLGVTLAATVHGRSPFERDTPLATMVSALQEPLPEEVVTGPLGEVIDRLLQKDPAARADAEEVRRLLEDAGSSGATAAATSVLPVLPVVEPPASAEGPPSAGSPADAERTQALPAVPLPPSGAAARAAAGTGGGGAAAGAAGRTGGARPGPAAPARRSWLVPALVAVALLVVGGIALSSLLGPGDEGDGDLAGRDAPTATAPAPDDPAEPAPPEASAGTPDGAAAPADEEPADEEPADAAPAEEEPAEEEPADPAEDAPAEDAPADDEPDDDRPAGDQVPAGFRLHTDDGYTVAVPEGWTIEAESGTRTVFSDPGSRRYLLVEEGGAPAGDPVEDWQRQERSVSRSGRLPGYELLGIDRVEYRDFDAADWQFTWEAENGPLRVRNRAVVDDDPARAFALYWSVPVEEWDASTDTFDQIAASFRPAG